MQKFLRKGQKGFTLVELLIVIAVLGALAAVVVPAVGNFMESANIAAANVEVQNVKTAAMSYLVDKGKIPTDSDQLSPGYISSPPKAKYTFDSNVQISGVSAVTGGWDFNKMEFKVKEQLWVKK